MQTDQPPKPKRNIFSFTPKPTQTAWLNELIQANNGNITQALQHCLDLAMEPNNSNEGVEELKSKLTKEIESSKKFINEYIAREKQFAQTIKERDTQITELTAIIEKIKNKSDDVIQGTKKRTGIGML